MSWWEYVKGKFVWNVVFPLAICAVGFVVILICAFASDVRANIRRKRKRDPR